MSGLVGNPACCFSDAKAQINNDFNVVKLYKSFITIAFQRLI